MARFQGLNVNALSLDPQQQTDLFSKLQRMDSISHTLMDDWRYTEQCATYMPNTLWAHRSWNPFQTSDDTRTYLEVAPEEWARRVDGFPKMHNVYHHMLNEPTNDDVPKLVQWLIDAMSITGRNGAYPTRCIIGNFAVDKSFQHIGDSIRWQDEWLKLFRAFEQHKDWHILGVHRYWIGDVRLAYADGYPANIRLDYPTHTDYLDPTKHTLLLDRLPNGILRPHWTGYADLWIYQLLIENNIAIPCIMETEGIHDEKRDDGSKPYTEYVDKNYPTEYNDGRGRGTWTWRRWSEASSGLPYIEQLNAQLIARHNMHLKLERDYPQLRGKQLGAHWFSYTTAQDWTKAGFSLVTDRDAPELIERMINAPNYKDNDMTQPTIFNPLLYDAMVSVTSGFWNLRRNMSVRSEDIGDITDTPQLMKVSRKTNGVNGYDWYKFERDGVTGYFADADKVKIDYLDDAQPDDPTPPDTTPDSHDELLNAINLLSERVAALEAQQATRYRVDVPFPNFTFEGSSEALELLAQLSKMIADIALVAHDRADNPVQVD